MILTNKFTTLTSTLFFIVAILIISCEQKAPVFECKDSLGCVDIALDEPIKIGVLQALSGKVASIGNDQVRGIELALAKKSGKLLGREVSLQIEDTGCSAEGGANAALKIIADPQQIAILGTTCSGAAATAAKASSQAGLVMVSGNNSAPFLTSVAGQSAPHWQPGYFRTAPNEENAGKAAAIYAYNSLGVRKAATINDGDIYTKGLTEGFIKAFEDLGGEITYATSVNKGEAQMGPVLTAVLYSQARLLFFPLFQPEGNEILLQARTMEGFADITLMSDGALIDSSFLSAVGEKGKGMYFVGPHQTFGPEGDLLAEEYNEKYGSSPSTRYYLSAYDAANILFYAIEKIAIKDPAGAIHIGRQALRDALYELKGFSGVTGTLNCDQFGDCGMPAFKVLRLDNPDGGIEALEANIMSVYSPENRSVEQ